MNGWWATIWTHDAQWIGWVAVLAMTLVAAIVDVRTHRIPNLLTMPGFLLGMGYAVSLGGFAGLADGFVGAALAFLPFVLLYAFAGGGAGDAKLMAAIGAWLGVIGALWALAGVMLAGAALALVYTIVKRRHREVAANFKWMLFSLYEATLGTRKQRREYILPPADAMHVMPYGLAIFLGTGLASGVLLLWQTA